MHSDCRTSVIGMRVHRTAACEGVFSPCTWGHGPRWAARGPHHQSVLTKRHGEEVGMAAMADGEGAVCSGILSRSAGDCKDIGVAG